jgi:hypothetical protein
MIILSVILLVTEPGKEEECMIRLSRVGYDNTIGYLEGGFASWKQSGKEIDTLKRITGASNLPGLSGIPLSNGSIQNSKKKSLRTLIKK